MRYINPSKVLSPRDFIEIIEILHDGGENSFSLAKISWEGNVGFAMRWNVARREWNDPEKKAEIKECVGMPSSHGYPVWFVIPNEFKDSILNFLKMKE